MPMAVGNAFDSCVKAYLTDKSKHELLFRELFDATVEEHHRKEAYPLGILVFNMYRATGALDALENDIVPGTCRPLDSVLEVINGVPLLGKPDLLYESKRYGCTIVDDWKVNGAMSERPKSPTAGYVDIFPSRGMHKDCILGTNGVNTLDIHEDHALQLPIYKMLTGADVVGITQLVFGKSPGPGLLGECRVALFRHNVSTQLMDSIKTEAKELWDLVTEYEPGKSFGTMSAERCNLLLRQGNMDQRIKELTGRA